MNEPAFEMSDREIVGLATINLLTMHEAGYALVSTSASMEYDLGVIHTLAVLCFPVTFAVDQEAAVKYVTNVLDQLRQQAA